MAAVGWGGVLGWGEEGWGFGSQQTDAQAPYALVTAWPAAALVVNSAADPSRLDLTLAWLAPAGVDTVSIMAPGKYDLVVAWSAAALVVNSAVDPAGAGLTFAWPAPTAFWATPAAARTARVLAEQRVARVGNDARTARVAR